ncbi:hypothetical protein ACJX0J_024594, partial [Zea mays]
VSDDFTTHQFNLLLFVIDVLGEHLQDAFHPSSCLCSIDTNGGRELKEAAFWNFGS